MARIDVPLVRPLPPVPRQGAQKSADPAGDDHDSDNTRTPSLRRTAWLQALDMQDDLSGLVSSMRRLRSRDDSSGDLRGHTWLEHVLDPEGPQKLTQLRNQLHQHGAANVAQLRTLLSQLFPDPSDAVAVLRILLADEELQELHAELQTLHDHYLDGERGRSVRAGVNVALKARLQAPRLRAGAAQLRRSYQEFLAGEQPLDAYELWIELYGFERRARVVDFIEQALAADMYALDPSCSRLEFGQLLQRVRQLTTLRSADHLLMACCWREQAMQRIGLSPAILVSALFGMVRRGGGLPALFDGVLSAARLAMDTTEKAVFAQGIRRFLKTLPHGLWVHLGLQEHATEEVDLLLDRIAAEERWSSRPAYRVEA